MRLNELRQIYVPDPIALLDHISSGHDEFGIIVYNLFQRPVFAVFRFTAIHDRHSHLYISILHLLITQDEIAFQFADSSNAYRVVLGSCIGINDILQYRTIVDAVIRVHGKVESAVGQIVLLFPGQRSAGFQIKAIAAVQDLGVLQDLDIPVQRLPFDMDALFLQIFENVVQACRRAEVVQQIGLYAFKDGLVAHLDSLPDIFFKDLRDDAARIRPLVFHAVILERFREASLKNIGIEFRGQIVLDRLSQEGFHCYNPQVQQSFCLQAFRYGSHLSQYRRYTISPG